MSWQDPVALTLAATLFSLALWWRHRLLKRGEGTHCAQCVADRRADPSKIETSRPAPPVTIDVSRLRLGRRR